METKSAKALNNYFISSIEFYKNIKPKTNLKEIKSDIKNKYQESEFEQHYQNFLSEIRLNSREYKDMWVILEYTSSNLSDVRKWNKYETIPQKVILETGFEVNFLIKLKLNLDKYHHLIEMTCSSESYGSTAMSLRNIFNHEMEVMREETKALRKAQNAPKEAPIIKPAIDDRFDYDKMMAECNLLSSEILFKIGFISDRLFDLKQWQLKFDEEELGTKLFNTKISKYKYTREYYPQFEQLCSIELERLNVKLDIEKNALTHKALANNPIIIQNDHYDYKWNATETDLLELVTALYKKQAFERRDGKAIKRIELINYFQELLGLEIKDVEGKLTRATGRNDNTPFLDGLRGAFKNYKVEKDAKKK